MTEYLQNLDRGGTYDDPTEEPPSQQELYEAARQDLIAEGLSQAEAEAEALAVARVEARAAEVRHGARLARAARQEAKADESERAALAAQGLSDPNASPEAISAGIAEATKGVAFTAGGKTVQDQWLDAIKAAVPGAVQGAPNEMAGPNADNTLEV